MTTLAPRTHRIDCGVFTRDQIRGLEVIEGPDRGRRFALTPGASTIGASREAHVHLSDPTVSRRHARLELRRGELEVEDLGALNGVFVEGQRVLHALVPPGARLRLGRTVLRPWLTADLGPVVAAPPAGALVAISAAMRELAALLRMLEDRGEPLLVVGRPGVGKRRVARHAATAGAQPRPHLEFSAEALLTADRIPRGATLLVHDAGTLSPAAARALLIRLGREGPARWILTLDPDAGETAADLARAALEAGAIEIVVPSLDARREDVPQLVAALLADLGHADFPLGPEALGLIQARSWPGQIAELKAYLRALVLGRPPPRPRAGTERIVGGALPYKEARAQMLDAFEREYVLGALDRAEGNVSLAARTAGIDRVYLHRLMKKHGLAGG